MEQSSFSMTKQPNEQWRPGDPTCDPYKTSSTISIDPSDPKSSDPRILYQLLIGLVAPRPIAFVSTISADGTKNLAPFSFFNMFGSAPPTFVVGFASGRGTSKDSCQNILDTKECTINIISDWFVEAANWCSITAPPGYSEWPSSGLNETPSRGVRPPCVSESAASFECKYVSHHDVISSIYGVVTATLIILEGTQIHIKESIMTNDKKSIDFGKLRPVSRLAGTTYGITTEGFSLPRINFDDANVQEALRLLPE
ncbi:hypothetical protein DL95DRAFT_449815 [Leptodontidium sp. 2 PMI_412]|nr:hypothetical protein DL95DRAFT_449815 [Leptodontidium sp. 2 PMI_412]